MIMVFHVDISVIVHLQEDIESSARVLDLGREKV
jgi:hypothetical protein